MVINVDLEGADPAVTLQEPEDCKKFHVVARGGDARRLGEALTREGAGHLLPSGDAAITVAAVRRMATGRVPGGWDADFDAMLGYARGKGWLDEAGEAIQAHVEWGEP